MRGYGVLCPHLSYATWADCYCTIMPCKVQVPQGEQRNRLPQPPPPPPPLHGDVCVWRADMEGWVFALIWNQQISLPKWTEGLLVLHFFSLCAILQYKLDRKDPHLDVFQFSWQIKWTIFSDWTDPLKRSMKWRNKMTSSVACCFSAIVFFQAWCCCCCFAVKWGRLFSHFPC